VAKSDYIYLGVLRRINNMINILKKYLKKLNYSLKNIFSQFILFINLYIIVITLSSLMAIGGCFLMIHFLSDISYDYVNHTEKPTNFKEEIIKLITKHLKSLNDVDEARINIFWPEIELFKENESEPIIANVIINPKDDAELPFNEKKIEGIKKMLLLGVERLKPENIIIYFELNTFRKNAKNISKKLESFNGIEEATVEILALPLFTHPEHLDYKINVIIKPDVKSNNSNIINDKNTIKGIENLLIDVFLNKYEDIKIMDINGRLLNDFDM
jgi:type III secretory pathway lipoprotein EscJ